MKIKELREKCLLLSQEEKEKVLLDLNNGSNSELVELIKLPFPQFAYKYLSKFPNFKELNVDHNFGYNLYLLTDGEIKAIASIAKGIFSRGEARTYYNIDFSYTYTFTKILLPFKDFNPLLYSQNLLWNNIAKYIYIAQYIDAKEAKKLKMDSFTFYTNGEYRGFELEEKVASLNIGMRKIIENYIGLNETGTRMNRLDISEKLGVTQSAVLFTTKKVLPLLLKNTKEFQSQIGYYGKARDNEANRYACQNEEFRKFDLSSSTDYILNNISSDEEREVLKTKTNKEKTLYLAAKYMYPSKETIFKYLNVTPKKADELAQLSNEGGKQLWNIMNKNV